MDVIDLAFYAGDEELLRSYLYTQYEQFVRTPSASVRDIVNRLIEIALSIEDHSLASDIQGSEHYKYINSFLKFRILQAQKNEAAYSLLASCFDNLDYARTWIDALEAGSMSSIYVYELGGLGDMIEGYMTIRTLLSLLPKRTKVNYLMPGKLCRFLNKYCGHPQMSCIDSDFAKSPGYLQSKPIHALHLIAYARHAKGIMPASAEMTFSKPHWPKVQQWHHSRHLSHLPTGTYSVLNLKSLPKLQNEATRRSYFLRSIDSNNCLRIINEQLTHYDFVVDITEYPRPEVDMQRFHSRYYHLDYRLIEFSDIMSLLASASSIHTIDSMLAHLAASLCLNHTLYLAKGHDQRWYKNLSEPTSMYSKTCAVYKQTFLNRWDSCILIR